MSSKKQRIRSNFSLGGYIAESDPLLLESYYDNGDYGAIQALPDPHRFIIGRTGSGKSAAFAYLREMHPSNVVEIKPENLSLPYLMNLGVIQQLRLLNVHLEPFLRALWKHVILIEVLKHRYKINSPEQKQNALYNLFNALKRDPGKTKAVQYLEEFGDKFWCETDERVRQIAETFEKKVNAGGNLDAEVKAVSIHASSNIEHGHTQEIRQELKMKYQRIVNETQLPRLNEMIGILHNVALDSPQHLTYLLIDDLDKDWVDEDIANTLIRCLFEAVIDMQSVQYLKILVALRTNIFEQLDYGQQRRGSQEEKVRGLALHIHWTRNDLKALLEQRTEVACRLYNIDPPKSLAELLPNKNPQRGDPLNTILDKTLMRPRDAIFFLNACLRQAAGRDRISWEHIHVAEKEYSEERLHALRDEWKDPYFDIDKVLRLFAHKSGRMSREQMTAVFDEIALLLVDDKFQGTTWLTELCEDLLATGRETGSWYDCYGQLANMLYRIGFLGIAKGDRDVANYSVEGSTTQLLSTDLSQFSYLEIHPAFQLALNAKPSVTAHHVGAT